LYISLISQSTPLTYITSLHDALPIFITETEISKYFEMLPNDAPLKARYKQMLSANGNEKKKLQDQLRTSIQAGDIDVNIMTKVDKTNYDKEGKPLPSEYTDALAALRGFA